MNETCFPVEDQLKHQQIRTKGNQPISGLLGCNKFECRDGRAPHGGSVLGIFILVDAKIVDPGGRLFGCCPWHTHTRGQRNANHDRMKQTQTTMFLFWLCNWYDFPRRRLKRLIEIEVAPIIPPPKCRSGLRREKYFQGRPTSSTRWHNARNEQIKNLKKKLRGGRTVPKKQNSHISTTRHANQPTTFAFFDAQ